MQKSLKFWIYNDFFCIQNERGFQKQPTIFQNAKRLDGAKKATLKRYTRTVGLGFKMPAEVRCEISSLKFTLLTILPALSDIICLNIH